MEYSKELVDGVKELYPNFKEIIEHTLRGSHILGRFLSDGVKDSIPISDVLEAKSLNELQSKASLYKRKQDLYYKWCCEHDDMLKNDINTKLQTLSNYKNQTT